MSYPSLYNQAQRHAVHGNPAISYTEQAHDAPIASQTYVAANEGAESFPQTMMEGPYPLQFPDDMVMQPQWLQDTISSNMPRAAGNAMQASPPRKQPTHLNGQQGPSTAVSAAEGFVPISSTGTSQIASAEQPALRQGVQQQPQQQQQQQQQQPSHQQLLGQRYSQQQYGQQQFPQQQYVQQQPPQQVFQKSLQPPFQPVQQQLHPVSLPSSENDGGGEQQPQRLMPHRTRRFRQAFGPSSYQRLRQQTSQNPRESSGQWNGQNISAVGPETVQDSIKKIQPPKDLQTTKQELLELLNEQDMSLGVVNFAEFKTRVMGKFDEMAEWFETLLLMFGYVNHHVDIEATSFAEYQSKVRALLGEFL